MMKAQKQVEGRFMAGWHASFCLMLQKGRNISAAPLGLYPRVTMPQLCMTGWHRHGSREGCQISDGGWRRTCHRGDDEALGPAPFHERFVQELRGNFNLLQRSSVSSWKSWTWLLQQSSHGIRLMANVRAPMIRLALPEAVLGEWQCTGRSLKHLQALAARNRTEWTEEWQGGAGGGGWGAGGGWADRAGGQEGAPAAPSCWPSATARP